MNAITVQYRDINTITQAFRFTAAQAQRMALTYVIQMGQLLTEAKELLNDRQEFERWLAEEAECKKSTAYNYMRIATEYGGAQVDLFGNASNAAMEKLTYSQAVALLAMPAEEREEFVEQHDVETMSTRELKKAIEERDAARREAEEAKEKAKKAEEYSDKADDYAGELERSLEDAKEDIEALQVQLETEKRNKPDVSGLERQVQTAQENSKRLEKSLETAQNDAEKVRKKLNEALERSQNLERELEETKAKPIIPLATLEKLSAEAAEQAEKDYAEKLEALERAKGEAQAEVERLRKQLAQSGEEVTICRTYLTDMTTMLNKMSGILIKLQGKEPEMAEKLKSAIRSILTQYVEKL